MAQLVHILQLLVRHYKVYYPVRHHLIQHMVNSIQRLGFTPNVSTKQHHQGTGSVPVNVFELVLVETLCSILDVVGVDKHSRCC